MNELCLQVKDVFRSEAGETSRDEARWRGGDVCRKFGVALNSHDCYMKAKTEGEDFMKLYGGKEEIIIKGRNLS